jgi:glycosyltransferase involved in cell wall biosynthesis
MDLTIIIPHYEEPRKVKSLVKNLRDLGCNYEIIVVDDKSSIVPDLSEFSNVQVFRSLTKGYFSGAVNIGIKRCSTDVLVLNQDVSFKNLKSLDMIADKKSRFAMIGESIIGKHPSWENGYIHGTFMFMRRDAIDKVGLLNDRDFPLWGSTCEWQLRACRKGYKVLPVLKVPGFVHERKNENFGSSIKRILEKEPDNRSLLIRTPPLFSVIVPSFNHGKYVEDLLASLMGGKSCLGDLPGQTFQAFDVIIVDDCSTDGSWEIVKSFEDPWKGIKVFQTSKNGGTSVACNLAISKSNAKFFARIDGDDMREPESLEKMYRIIEENPDKLIYDDITIFVNGQKQTKSFRMQDYDFDQLIHKNHIHAGIMVSKEAWKAVGGYPEAMVNGRDDWAFNVALGRMGYCGIHVNNPGYLYRRDGQNRTLRNTTPAWRDKFLSQLKSLFPDVYGGKRPAMCCGDRQPSNSGPRNSFVPETFIAGSTGMALVDYLGKNIGTETFFGPFTGIGYTFSSKKYRRRVDIRDLHYDLFSGKKVGLLDVVQNGKPLFKLYKESNLKISESPPSKVDDLVQTVSDTTEIVSEPVVISSPEIKKDEEVTEISTEEYSGLIAAYSRFKGIGKSTADKLISAGYLSTMSIANAEPSVLAEALAISETKAISIIRIVNDGVD